MSPQPGPTTQTTEVDTGDLRRVLRRAASHAADWLEGLPDRPVAPTAALEELRDRLGHPLSEDGLASDQVLDELVRDTAGGLMGSTGGSFFGWVIGGALPAALAADWMTSAWDQNAALYAASPAAAVLEEIAGSWLKELLGLPPAASFAFVTGCQMAHVTALAAARHRLLDRVHWDVERRGLHGAPAVTVLVGDLHHASIDRALRMLGIGTDAIQVLGTDPLGRMRLDELEAALKESAGQPTIVSLQAGDLNAGAVDDFSQAIPLIREHPNAWAHVDGAFGLWAAAASTKRHLVVGVEAADSWAVDGHKWLNTPFDSGYAIVADAQAHRAAFAVSESYLVHSGTMARDQLDWTPEWSRRGRGVATYAALRNLGRSGIADLVENCCLQAQVLTLSLAALPGVELLHEPTLNQGLVRFLSPGDRDHDEFTDSVIAAIQTDGRAWFGGTSWRGQRAMRISVCNWRTGTDHVDRAVAAVKAALENAASAI